MASTCNFHRHFSTWPFLLLVHRCAPIIPTDHLIMSKALMHELDLKMQQMKEYGLIAHGYHNENVQYPVHVRRSHDGEKVSRPHVTPDKYRTTRLIHTPVLISSTHENHISNTSKRKSAEKKQQPTSVSVIDEQVQRTFLVPPNKTIDDIDPSLDRDQSFTIGQPLTRLYYHRKSSSSSGNSSPILSTRPHSFACLSTTETITTTTESSDSTKTDEDLPNPLSNSSQSLTNQSTSRAPIRAITQKFLSRLFNNPSKS